MTRMLSRGRLIGIGVLLLLVIVGVVLWTQRHSFLSGYHVNGLAEATDKDRESWLNHIVKEDNQSLPEVLELYQRTEPQACTNATIAMDRQIRLWGWDDERTLTLVRKVADKYSWMSPAARLVLLDWQERCLGESDFPEPMKLELHKIYSTACKSEEIEVRKKVLAQADRLLVKLPSDPYRLTCRFVVARELKAKDTDMQLQAVHLCVQETFQDDVELLQQVIPLFQDDDAQVRRAAVLAVGSLSTVVSSEDTLLPLLHDKDANVRRMTESALRRRGLMDSHILMARFISSPQPQQRMQVFQHLRQTTDLEPGLWLLRMSRDPSPAVRAAAIRETLAYPGVNLNSRLQEMTENDPSPTVQQLAGYYLQKRKS